MPHGQGRDVMRRAGLDEASAPLHHLVDVYRAHQVRVRRVCVALLGDSAAAEDATQEVFLRVRDRVAELPAADLAAYLTVVARNVCLDELGRRGRRRRLGEALRAIDRPVDVESRAVDRRLVAEVWERLSWRDRALFLYRFAGFSHAEIARRFAVSPGAVRIALLRARRRARALVEGQPLGALFTWLAQRRETGRRRGVARQVAGTAGWGRIAATAVTCTLAIGGVTGFSLRLASVGESPGMPVAAVIAAAPASVAGGGPLDGLEVGSLTVSPASAADHVVIASGYRPSAGCGRATCPALARSDDGGATWRMLAGAGYAGGPVLVAPTRVPGRSLYATGPVGLQRSDDGGATFHTVVGVVGPAVVAPWSSADDVAVVIGARPLRIYHAASGAVTTASGVAVGDGRVDAISGTGDGRALLVAVHEPGAVSTGSQMTGAVWRCGLTGGCVRVLVVTDAPSVRLVPSTAMGRSGVVLAVSDHRVDIVVADGLHAHRLRLPAADDHVDDAAASADGHGRLRVVVEVVDRVGRTELLAPDGRIGGEPTPALRALTLTPGMVLLGAVEFPAANGTWGVRCSSDGGRDWRTTCR